MMIPMDEQRAARVTVVKGRTKVSHKRSRIRREKKELKLRQPSVNEC